MQEKRKWQGDLFLDNTCKKSLDLWRELSRSLSFLICPCKCSSLEAFTFEEDLGYKDVKVATGTNAHQTYKLNEATAVDQNIYGQWVFTWVEPAEYVEKDVNVQQYTATKHNKNYDVFVMTDANQNVIGGYYYEAGQTMNEAKILDEKHTPRIVKDFESTWNRLFNINQTTSTDTTDTQGQNR